MKRDNLIGNRYGRLLVTGGDIRVRNGRKEMLWECICDCGKTSHSPAHPLKHGSVISCGCYKNSQLGIASLKHGNRVGRKFTAEYRAWVNMKTRCENPKWDHSDRYLGRGISYCDEWKDFAAFLSDMGKSPGEYYSLDRKDNNGGYSKENCRWATRRQQAQNTRRNVLITVNGVTKCLAEWARVSKIHHSVLRLRHLKGISIGYLTDKLKEVGYEFHTT